MSDSRPWGPVDESNFPRPTPGPPYPQYPPTGPSGPWGQTPPGAPGTQPQYGRPPEPTYGQPGQPGQPGPAPYGQPGPAPYGQPGQPPYGQPAGQPQPYGQALADPQTPSCSQCGYQPAAPLKLRRLTGMVLLWRMRTTTRVHCRVCGETAYRDTQAHNLVAGWWGIIAPIANLVSIIMNVRAHRTHARIGPPVSRNPYSNAPAPAPVTGKPISRRPLAIIVPIIALLLISFVIVAAATGDTPAKADVGSCITNDGKIVTCGNSDAVYEITARTASADDCPGTAFRQSRGDDQGVVLCVKPHQSQ